MKSVFALVVISFVQNVFSANILYVGTLPSPSHHIFNKILVLELVRQGHNVTYLAPDNDKQPETTNYTFIQFEGVYRKLYENFNINEWMNRSLLNYIIEALDIFGSVCEWVAESNGFSKLNNYPKSFKFDLMILDTTCGTCTYSFIHRFDYLPTVAVTAQLLPPYVSNGLGNPLFPSFIPSYFLNHSTDMSLSERLLNYIITYFDIFVRNYRETPREYEVMKKVLGDDLPPLEHLERHISLVLANTDPILDVPQPLSPNIIPVGGLHTKNAQPLPENLQRLLDASENGVIVFSLGTNMRSDHLGKDIQEALLQAFSKLNETVIWKFESEISNLPKNVIVQKWLPQNDILRHKNVKLFIGHGGALSTQEALFHEVPIITIPFMIDQYLNTKNIIQKKVGTTIELSKITEAHVLEKVLEVLKNPMYHQNVKKLSETFRDRLETPLERAIFWIEYVLRHKNVDFLSLPSRDMPLYKTIGLDIFLILLISICTLFIVLRKILLLTCNLFVRKEKTE